ASIPEMRTAMEQGRVTSRQIVTEYLTRIATYEDTLHAALAVNPRALEEADARDRERAAGKVRGPLHGIPVALKDNIHTTDMPTTGGALAFDGFVPPFEATVTRRLRDAGAIIIAKTVLTELANWVASGMPANYSALAGYGMNPYDPRRDPREATFDGRPAMSTGGSSSGIGTAASFWAANIGTETSGSILSPANQNMLAAIKPTVGRVSRYGIIPITADQDTAGPMARTVADVAIVLGALEQGNPDPNDAATSRCPPPAGFDYTPHLKPDGLKGARIGIPRAFFYDRVAVPGSDQPRGGLNPEQAKVMAEAIAVLKEHGATVVDPADIPSVVSEDPAQNFLTWGICSGTEDAKGKDEDCSVILKYGMKRDFNAWLDSLGPSAPVKSLAELRKWNEAHQKAGAIKYAQANLDISDDMDVEADRPRWQADRAKDILLAATNGIDAALKTHQLDALLIPGASGSALAARPGYPTVMVPFGFVPNVPFGQAAPFPPGFNAKPQPYGVSFTGTACSEPRLLELAYAFEQATRRRVPPPGLP
ncbi:MAG TPA: amidase family protein, partial [Vicinamibacterales bacterium]|nr:amidase family protein [Vicinamibacterales bacterium]